METANKATLVIRPGECPDGTVTGDAGTANHLSAICITLGAGLTETLCSTANLETPSQGLNVFSKANLSQ